MNQDPIKPTPDTPTVSRTAKARAEANKKRAEKDTCKAGHSFEGDNLYFTLDGRRQCRACNRQRCKEYRHRQWLKKVAERKGQKQREGISQGLPTNK